MNKNSITLIILHKVTNIDIVRDTGVAGKSDARNKSFFVYLCKEYCYLLQTMRYY